MIGLISATAAGRTGCERLAAAWPGRTVLYDDGARPLREVVGAAFAECDQLVLFLATGAAVRLLAPHLRGKAEDPGVVTVDEAHRYAVALLGGHGGGANSLAAAVSSVLGAEPVVTTATDAVGATALDTLPYPAEGALPAVTRALLDGTPPVTFHTDTIWPHPPLPPALIPAPPSMAEKLPPGESATRKNASPEASQGHPREDGSLRTAATGRSEAARPGGAEPTPAERGAEDEAPYAVWLTDRRITAGNTVFLRPPSLTVGIGGSRGVTREEVVTLVRSTLAEAGLAERSVTALATVDAKASEAGIVAAAAAFGVPLLTFPADTLAAIPVPNPSAAPLAAVGTASVAEAAALAAAPGGELVAQKRKSAMATAAVARRHPRGRLAVVGLGPGARDLVTPRAVAELRRASVLVGLDQYVDQIRDLLAPGTRVLESGLGAEEERARTAVAEARAGHAVALIGSGDAGVYAMASPALAEAADDIDVVGVPGVTAALAAAALLGAPLGHDHVSISLSDLHTPWDVIERRVRAAAEADLVVTFYNPRSRGRDWQLPKALSILAGHRAPDTPVGVVHAASRPDERVAVTTLAGLDPATVDMVTVVTVGNTASRTVAGRMVTPRGYRWQAP
ncbi:cobalt-precorrin 5A hydrolase / precorrin-3B C17-methyltransferase [Actinacidiphila alni]|uniref:Cobalt-precorrin 5A hydrolase / precorrin-3B C17-methyltransferase n=1 Tax=Actinacidiphila alni TaxID=380248 RepID=A0A1I2GIQ3_9ACTN|nr:precorrin-3B C(17)-methyltransferase [Actinacidiphila alni]SFF16929.1 cobalt-precorrin 5A hydrolase / precorrin-3B C17-methyltransferase [Actinacidiphila alni]